MGWLDALRRTRDRVKEIFTGGPAAFDGEARDAYLSQLLATDLPPRLAEKLLDAIVSSSKGRDARTAAKEVLAKALGPKADFSWDSLPRPAAILLVGINGAGKTTTAAKLAQAARSSGRKPLLGAADTYRAAGSEQLRRWGDRLGIRTVVGQTGGDAAATAFDAWTATKARGLDTLVLDTAGRMHTRGELMAELPKMRAALAKQDPAAPHATWLVLDGMLGQNALSQARAFDKTAGVTGVIVTKLDGSGKAGFLFAVRETLDLPILFAGLGEGENDLAPFDPDAFLEAYLPPA